ncbi:CHAD domain-containing protein [bacterium RCC_150]
MPTQEKVETERKYDVPLAASLPAFGEVQGVERVADPEEHRLEAVYFDTDNLVLAKHRLTLRRRTGGSDPGWHLKLPAAQDGRTEVHAPLGQPDAVPDELAERVLVLTRGSELKPVARVHTRRIVHRLHGSKGLALAEFADDHVSAEALHPAGPAHEWREWEVELVHGDEALLKSFEDVLSQAGVSRSGYSSKLARTFGSAWPQPLPAPSKVRRKGPAGDAIVAYLTSKVAELMALDPLVRQGADDAVHDMRSTARRIRSVLAAYGRLFDADASAPLKAELKWLTRILGKARDAEVLRDRIGELLNAQPDDALPDPAAAKITDELDGTYNSGYRELLRSMGTDRYFRLLDSLEQFRDHPPTRGRAKKKARPVTAKLSAKSVKRLRKSQKRAARTVGDDGHDVALHQVRKDAKRVRHAAEALQDLHGKRAKRLAQRAHKIQSILGEHQDSVIARSVLARFAKDAGGSERASAAFDPLLAAEKQRAADSEARYSKLDKKKNRLEPL